MSAEDTNPRPPVPFIVDGSQDAALIVALNEQRRRAQQAAYISSMAAQPHVPAPPPPPVFVYDGSQDAALIAAWEANRRRSFIAAVGTGSVGPVHVPEDDFLVVVTQTVIVPYDKTSEGQLIRSATLPLMAIIRKILEDPSRMYEISPRKWEEIIAAAYDESRQFDEVTLTPPSGDRGRDVIAVKRGFGSVRLIESVKRNKPGHVVTAEEVQALLGVLHGDPQASKGIVSTTWEFAPRIKENPHITQYLPHRLELVNGTDLVRRLAEYTGQNG
jgi:restriction system protein